MMESLTVYLSSKQVQGSRSCGFLILGYSYGCRKKEIDGNPPVNPALISFESNLTGKTPANRGDGDDISQNP
jgi:hypothetical protein